MMSITRHAITFGCVVGFIFCFWLVMGGTSAQVPSQSTIDVQGVYEPMSVMPAAPTVPVQPLTRGVVNSSGRDIFYWVQVSDIHIDMSKDLDRLGYFDQFCSDINATIKPAFVVSTGDNVDAHEQTIFDFYSQDVREYQAFNATLAKYNFTSNFWFAVIGNHEIYDQGLNRTLFAEYLRNQTQYAVDFTTGFGTYRFVMLDSTQKYGLQNPLNLFGDFQADKLDNLEALLNYGSASARNQTILIEHQPTNEISSEVSHDGKSFQDLIAASKAQYLFDGHLHDGYYYDNHGDFTEAECTDFKDDHGYRICAFDDDIASFSEQTLGKFPAICVTSPTDARFYNANMPLGREAQHNEIRALLFDNTTITSAYAVVDGQVIGNLTNQGQNLWAVPWSPANYISGVHHLAVHASSANGDTVEEFDFELSGFSPTPIISAAFLQWFFSTPMVLDLNLLFFALAACNIGLLLLPKASRWIKTRNQPAGAAASPALGRGQPLLQRAVALPAVPSALLLASTAYVIFGPTLVGMFTSQSWGVMFLNKIFVGGGYDLDPSTYLF